MPDEPNGLCADFSFTYLSSSSPGNFVSNWYSYAFLFMRVTIDLFENKRFSLPFPGRIAFITYTESFLFSIVNPHGLRVTIKFQSVRVTWASFL